MLVTKYDAYTRIKTNQYYNLFINVFFLLLGLARDEHSNHTFRRRRHKLELVCG